MAKDQKRWSSQGVICGKLRYFDWSQVQTPTKSLVPQNLKKNKNSFSKNCVGKNKVSMNVLQARIDSRLKVSQVLNCEKSPCLD